MELEQELDEDMELALEEARLKKGIRAEPYALGELILCTHTDNLLYQAKIVAVEKQEPSNKNDSCDYLYTIHYQGWSKRYDENILHSQTGARFWPRTPENLEKCRKDMLTAKAINEERRKKKKRSNFSKTTGGSSAKGHGCSSSSNSLRERKSWVESSDDESSSDGRSASRERKLHYHFLKWLCDSEPNAVLVLERMNAVLDHDRRTVQEKWMIHKLPARYSVAKILYEFASNARRLNIALDDKRGEEQLLYWKAAVLSLDEWTESLQTLFDSVVEKDILLPNEVPQFKELAKGGMLALFNINEMYISKQRSGLRPSECYGFMHLLRLADQYENSICDMYCDEESKKVFLMLVQTLLVFLMRHAVRYFDPERDYEHSPLEYRQTVHHQTA